MTNTLQKVRNLRINEDAFRRLFKKKTKLVFCGNITLDRIMMAEGFPEEGKKLRTNKAPKACSGGPACNAACVPSFLDKNLKTYFIGVVAGDQTGRLVKRQIRKNRVNTSLMQTVRGKDVFTPEAHVWVNSTKATRTNMVSRPLDFKVTKKCKKEFDVAEFDGENLDAALEILKNNPGIISILDAGRVKKETDILGKLVTHLVCSEEYAEEFYYRETGKKIKLDTKEGIKEAYRVLENTFDKQNIIITLGVKGCIYKADDQLNLVPTIEVKPVDTNGAGDIFHGAFAYCMAKGMNIEDALIFSNVVASLSVTKPGGRTSIPTMKEVEAAFNKVKMSVCSLDELGKIYKLSA